MPKPGAPDTPPLILLHAPGQASQDWEEVAGELGPGWRVYAPDLHGHGTSDWSGPYPVEQLTADLAAFLDALGLRRVALAGHSLGSAPACLYAARFPDRVSHLLLEEPVPPFPRPRPDGPEGRTAFDRDAAAISREPTDPPQAWSGALRQITAPTLIIAGGPGSHVDQEHLARMAALIPDCALMSIPVGHRVHAAAPAEFTAAVTSFLTGR